MKKDGAKSDEKPWKNFLGRLYLPNNDASEKIMPLTNELTRMDSTMSIQKSAKDVTDAAVSLAGKKPKRLVDFFCVVGPQPNMETIIPKPSDEDPNPKFKCCVLDCYPKARNDVEFPQHIHTFCFPNGCQESSAPKEPTLMTIVLTSSTGHRLYGALLTMFEEYIEPDLEETPPKKKQKHESPTPKSKKKRQKRYIPKCLVVLSHYEYFHVYRTFLQQLYRIFKSGISPLPMERFINNFCQDIPLPSINCRVEWNGFMSKNSSNGMNNKIVFQPSAPNELPLVNFSYKPLFRTLSIPNVLVAWGILLQEGRLILCSNYHSLLTPVAQALLTLLFPLEWHGMFIPVLPSDMIDVLDAPVPYLVGMDRRYLDSPSFRHPEGVVICDLDNDVVHLGWDYDWQPRGMPDLPDRNVMTLKLELDELVDHLYLAPSTGIKGRITNADGKTMENTTREPYSQMTRLGRTRCNDGTILNQCHRESILSNAERAFVDDAESLQAEDFAFHQEQHIRYLSSRSVFGTTTPSTQTNANSHNLVSSLRRQARAVQAHTDRILAFAGQTYATTPTPVVEQIKPKEMEKIAGQLYSLDTDGTIGHDIRLAFLRFFTMLFLQYKKFLKPTPTGHVQFQKSAFLSGGNWSTRNQRYVAQVLDSQMFERFLQESPKDPRIRFFDEHIVLAKNAGASRWSTGGGSSNHTKSPTPFLDSTEFNILRVITPPGPKTDGIRSGRTYSYTQFPKLKMDEPRKMKAAETTNKPTSPTAWCAALVCGEW